MSRMSNSFVTNIFFICITTINISLITSDLPSEVPDLNLDPFPTEKCESMLHGCACYDYEVVAGISCSNITNFSSFSSLLANGSIFEVNTTFEITVTSLRSLPPRSLEGLIVFRLYLDDPQTQAIEDGAFDGVYRLRRFHIRQSSIKAIPDFRVIKDSLRNLNFDDSHLTALKGPHLQGLYLLETLSFYNNSISTIEPSVFKGTDGVLIFDLGHNELTSLPPNIFDNWTQLKKVVLSHNQLFHVNMLFAVTHPKFIYLDYNNLTDIDAILYPNMENVETVLFGHNPLRKISANSFNKKVPQMRFLYLDYCQLEDFDVQHFKTLANLSTLDLSYNHIKKISNQTIAFGKNLELQLMGNQIQDFKAEMTFTVKRLYMNENYLETLGRTLQFTQLAEVSISKNNIQFLSTNDFKGVHGMANVDLRQNSIQWIDTLTFLTIRNDLHFLDLSENRIPSLNGSVRYLSQLKSLNVSWNQIGHFVEGEFTGLNELSELYLQSNRILTLSGQLQQLPQLQYLIISENAIQTLYTDQIPAKLQFLYLKDNPFSCDCSLLSFLQWLNTSDSPQTDVPICIPSIVTESTLEHAVTCPEPCSCTCASDHPKPFMNVNCSGKNLSAPLEMFSENYWTYPEASSDFIIQLQFGINQMQSSEPQFVISDRVGGLNLQNNQLDTLTDWRFPTGLKRLYLANNHLQRFPVTPFFNKLKNVTLSGNPWDCDCETVLFSKWLLSKAEIVQDLNDTRCAARHPEESPLDNKPIASLSAIDFCPTDIGFYISLAFGLLCFLLVIAALKITYTRYELNVKVWLYSHGVTWVKAKDIEKDKIFDAFLSFSHKDESFVANQIISVLEDRLPNIQLCIHYRNFPPGEFIHDNILNAVQCSKRTVLILSRNFLDSEWCLMEFRAAHVQALKDRVHRIIVIKLGDLPEAIDPNIQVYLDSTTYLTWGEKYFWQNLLYIFPTPGKTQTTQSEQKILGA